MSKPAPVTSAGVPFETTVHVRDHCLCLAAQRAARTLARRFDEALRPAGLTSGQYSPKIEKCPADRVQIMAAWADFSQRRTYAMNSAGVAWGGEWQVGTAGQTYPLPTAKRGIGIYWQDDGLPATRLPDWDAKGYKTATVKDPAGTILLVEEPNYQNVVGNVCP